MEDEEFEVIDTPGMYTLLPITEEDRVARSILLEEKPEVILHVVDARNLERLLPLTLFVPCIAQFSVMLKERGIKTALAITLFIFPFAFFVGFILNLVLTTLGVSL